MRHHIEHLKLRLFELPVQYLLYFLHKKLFPNLHMYIYVMSMMVYLGYVKILKLFNIKITSQIFIIYPMWVQKYLSCHIFVYIFISASSLKIVGFAQYKFHLIANGGFGCSELIGQ